MNEAMMTLRAKNRETGEELVVSVDNDFMTKLRESGREDLILITETLMMRERQIQSERAFQVAGLVTVRDLLDRGGDGAARAFTNTAATMLMDRYKDEMLGMIGDEGMQAAALQASELLSSVIMTMQSQPHKPELEH